MFRGCVIAVIIGQGTVVTTSIASQGIISIDWSSGAGVERLYTLGQGMSSCGPVSYAVVLDSSVSVSFSLYGGISTSISTCANKTCADSPAMVTVSVTPGTCGSAISGLTGQKVFISSYSYSKERGGHGTEQWQGNAYKLPASTGGSNVYVKPLPSYVILGLAEGTVEGDGTRASIETMTGAHMDTSSPIAQSERASVQASQISIGDHSIVYHGVFSSVGGSQFWDATGTSSVAAKASVNLSLQPIWV